MNDELSPLRTVSDKNLVAMNVAIMPKTITAVRISEEVSDENIFPAKNTVISNIMVGNFPLHGTRLFVITASSLSLGESIILHPVTPTALHPNPMHIVSACFPQALQRQKGLSRLYAILGRNPESSITVKRGKNIAIGGNITETTHASTR